ncbi:alpha-hydroxy-acid oxidizing protein [Glutamicibacter halophytocola]|uniref:Alpha-hydroxy-acid oxidizing protein n=1 Tax=Glutamicibacter halophytocola TaxID=1933880 RepID=A0ABX5YDQ1_9MICC|nr:alpha-hydroxy acid oxidase [Glutamicibacter halophytocola]NQD42743.1 alpha-hydroxy-acid oxidizing protein [Glutamicibacter halophytocola]QDY67784.1 alpha-hydroxy-acid oxidizing protein [Glutamicibacter halophytocola]
MRNKWIVSIDDYRRASRWHLPKMITDYLDGGALDEITTRANRESLDALMLRQRSMVDLSDLRTDATVLGQQIDLPLIVAPMGMLTIFHPGSDTAVARAAVNAGSIFIHSAWAGCALEEVAPIAGDKLWAQVAFWKDPEETESYIKRARKAGVKTLVVAGDVGSSSKRERDLHHGLSMPPRPPVVDYLTTAMRPQWIYRWLTGRKMTYGNYSIDGQPLRMDEMNQWMAKNKNPGANWADFAWLREQWDGNLVIKGIMDPEDAARAVDEGADGIFISNHGGRQFDAQPATIDVLPSIVSAVNGRAEIYLDGGIRRGHDMVKAIGLGATAVMAGRPFAYALATGGEPAVSKAFKILHDEFKGAMGFVGKTRVSEIDESVFAQCNRITDYV